MADTSADCWIERMNAGEEDAVGWAFRRYSRYVRVVARRKISRELRVLADSEDFVQSVFIDLLAAVRRGGLRFSGPSQLCAFLWRITRRRLADRYRRHRNALVRERSLDETPPRDIPVSASPRPSQVAQARELWERVLERSTPTHREVLRLKSAGLALADIAEHTGLHEGSVRRIIYELARRLAEER